MSWNWMAIICFVSTGICIFSLSMIGAGEIEVKQTQKLNEITGKYEPRYEEHNVNILFGLPFFIFFCVAFASFLLVLSS